MVPLSTGDYPDCLSAVIFCQGCPWRCRYCHNPHLQARQNTEINFSQVFQFLEKRAGLLDAVVFSGGEPTYQAGIAQAIGAARQLGFKIGLHTGAPKLSAFSRLLPLLNWVGLDIKAPEADYAAVTGIADSGGSPFQGLALLLEAGLDFEVRTTYHPLLYSQEKLLELASTLAQSGVKNYALQIFRTNGCQDDSLNQVSASLAPEIIKELSSKFENFILRD